MVSRRALLGTLGLGGVGGYLIANNPAAISSVTTAVESSASTVTGPPPTETLVAETGSYEQQFGGMPIKNIEMYESGAAIVKPATGRGECQERFAIMHSNTSLSTSGNDQTGYNVDDSAALQSWAFGDFDEAITIDLKAAIQRKSNYPSRMFKIRLYPSEGVCLTIGQQSGQFQVPESYLP